MGFIKPNYNKSILNLTASLVNYFKGDNHHKTLKIVDDELNKNYKNIVFIVFDGLGINPININLNKSNFIPKNIKLKLTSTFPSTTTNATTTINTNLSPLEHGWFGWTMRFNELDKTVVLFKKTDAITKEPLDINYPMPDSNDYWFNYIDTDYNITTVMPHFSKPYDKSNVVADTLDELFTGIKSSIANDNKNFIFAYATDPDHTMHEFGVTSPEANSVIKTIDNGLIDLFNTTTDTLFIITADHGQIDVKGEIEFYLDTYLNDMLICPPYMESRAPAFWVKDEYKEIFPKEFKKRYGKDFKIYKSKTLIDKGYFGNSGEFGYLLGDYIAIGTDTNKVFVSLPPEHQPFKGHHTSLTKEMLVPLIMFNT